MEPKYPHITVQLSNMDGNVFSIIGRVMRALRENDVPKEDVNQFVIEMKSGDYDNALQTVMRWVNTK